MMNSLVMCLLPILFCEVFSIENVEVPDSSHEDFTKHPEVESTHSSFQNFTDVNTTVFENVTEKLDNQTTHVPHHDEGVHLEHATEGNGVDANGCHTTLRNEMEKKCFDKFEDAIALSTNLPDASDSEKEVCCSLEEYEKCCIRGFKEANCEEDRDTLRETLKSARLFLGAVAKHSCASYRGKCDFSSSTQASVSSFALTTSAVFLVIALV